MVKTVKQALDPAFLKQKPNREQIELFKKEFKNLLDKINQNETEEFHKRLITDFLNAVYYKDKHYINTKGRNDLVIHNDNNPNSFVGVLIEAKNPKSKTEMVSRENLNVKSFHELILYYLRERITEKNLELRNLIITNINEWFVFDAQNFENTFGNDKELIKKFNEFENKTSAATKTETFYKEIAAPAIDRHIEKIEYSHFNIDEYKSIINNTDKNNESKLVALYKFLSPVYLLKLHFASDNNQLNKEFYAELLHIIGLEEITQDGKKLIVRKKEGTRDFGSIIENTIEQISNKNKWDDVSVGVEDIRPLQFDVALDLAITWINRILFLKLLESQIIKYNNGNKEYAFLAPEKLTNYNDLETLFFSVLALKEENRSERVKSKFANIPYLNSSLFELTEMEDKTISIGGLQDNIPMPLFSKSVLHSQTKTSTLLPLEYLLRFLDAYDFSNESSEEIMEESKPLISASVLGLIFEKINGYKDGSFFTPSFITMYMCRETIGRAVVQKFNEVKKWNCETIKDLYNKIEDIDEANTIFNTIRICDPAVGSGHFLVSALNEMLYLKSELGILIDKNGKRLKDYHVVVENDELIITDHEGNYFNYNPKDKVSQRVQETFFHEKQTIIENCLFGVDINPNSVKICQLRLWIELLKNAYYHFGTNELQTLPNIDINIKCGNSLMSRFDLTDKYLDYAGMKNKVIQATKKYKQWVSLYKSENKKEAKKEIVKNIETEKSFLYQIPRGKDPDYINLYKAEKELAEHMSGYNYFEAQTNNWDDTITVLTEIVNKFKEIYYEKIRGCFEWRFEFPEVLDDDGNFVGFDVVIGNPPYGVKLKKKNQIFYSKKFNLLLSITDTFLMFIKQSYLILKPNSHLSLIVPSTWLYMSQYKSFRKDLVEKKRINEVVLIRKSVFDNATVETCILHSKNIYPNDSYYSFREITNNISNFAEDILSKKQIELFKEDDCNLVLSNFEEQLLFNKIKTDALLFKDIALIVCGLTPYRKGKGLPPQTEEIVDNRCFDADYKKDETYRRYIMGRDFNRFTWSIEKERWLSYGKWIAEPRFSAPFNEDNKIIIRQTSDKLIAHLDTNKFLSLKNVHNVKITNDSMCYEYLLALLNSRLMDWWYQKLIPEKGRIFAEVKVVNLEQLPIKNISSENQQPLIPLVSQILSLKKENPAADTSALEREIDALVYRLYGLTEEEIGVIERGSSPKD